MGAADFMKGDYKQIVWLKPKMALVLLNAGLSLFTLDSDILFFRVPDLAKVTAANPNAELFYQWEKVDYEQLYAIQIETKILKRLFFMRVTTLGKYCGYLQKG